MEICACREAEVEGGGEGGVEGVEIEEEEGEYIYTGQMVSQWAIPTFLQTWIPGVVEGSR